MHGPETKFHRFESVMGCDYYCDLRQERERERERAI